MALVSGSVASLNFCAWSALRPSGNQNFSFAETPEHDDASSAAVNMDLSRLEIINASFRGIIRRLDGFNFVLTAAGLLEKCRQENAFIDVRIASNLYTLKQSMSFLLGARLQHGNCAE